MLLGTLAASDSVIIAGEFSYSTLCFNKHKSIVKLNLYLMVSIREIIYLKHEGYVIILATTGSY